MQVQVHCPSFSSSGALAEFAEAEVRKSLQHVSHRVTRVIIWLEDCNGPRGGADKRCRIEAHLERLAKPMLADASGSDLYAVIGQASNKLGKSVSRTLDKRRTVAERGKSRRHIAA